MEEAITRVEEGAFWRKVRKVAGKVPFVPDAVAMYYAFRDPVTPLWVKLQIGAAIAYFVLPTDAVPDLVPFLGYADDAGVLAATLTLVGAWVSEAHRSRALEWLDGA